MDFQINEQQLRQISEQFGELNNKIMELEYISQSLDEIGKLEKGTEILAPISSGIFIKADIKDSAKLLINIGSGAVVPKTIKETKELLKKQLDEIEGLRGSLMMQLNEYSLKSQKLEQELKELTEGR
jgi:prefoldin alpha subunit